MQRKSNQQGRPKAKKRKIRGSRYTPPLRGALVPLNTRHSVTFHDLIVLAGVGASGTNKTYPLFALSSLSPAPIGLTAMYNNGSNNGMYNCMRLVSATARIRFSNQEAFSNRVIVYMGSQSPANASLVLISQQIPYLSRLNGVSQSTECGPLTGNGTKTLVVRGTNRTILGVSNQRGMADSYTNSFDSATDTDVAATSGLSLVLCVASVVAGTAAGVLIDVEVDLIVEFFSPALKSS